MFCSGLWWVIFGIWPIWGVFWLFNGLPTPSPVKIWTVVEWRGQQIALVLSDMELKQIVMGILSF